MKYFRQNQPCGRVFCLLRSAQVLFALAAHAATVRGTIADSLGAVIPKARVELIDQSKGYRFDDRGRRRKIRIPRCFRGPLPSPGQRSLVRFDRE